MRKIATLLICILSLLTFFTGCASEEENVLITSARKKIEEEVSVETDIKSEHIEAILEEEKNYALYQLIDGRYMYEIRNCDDVVIYREVIYRFPNIEIFDSNFLEVTWGAGTGIWTGRYFDLENCFVSDAFTCTHYVGNGIIALVASTEEGERYLRLMNPFSYSEYSQNFEIDFASEEEILVESSCIIEISQIVDGKIKVVYLNHNVEEVEVWVELESGDV